jgi:hypothetical protein
MRKLRLSLALVALCLLAVACGDDDPVKPEVFAVTVHVTDLAGDPVEGLRVGLVNDHAFFPDGVSKARASVVVPFRVDVEAQARLTIEDIEGQALKGLDYTARVGSHSWMWNGMDDADVPQPSGRYTAHIVLTNVDTGLWMFEDRTDMLLSNLDPSRVPAGYTDQDGKLVLKDKKLFPHLYDRPDMTATNENAEAIGEFNLTPQMRISLADTSGGGHMNFMMVIPGATTLNLVWDPSLAVSDESTDPGEPIFPGVALTDTTPPPSFELGLVYPNPFN